MRGYDLQAQQKLERERGAAAERAFERFHFPSDVEGTGGWESASGADRWERTVFLADEENEDGPSIRERFVVEFAPDDAEVLSAGIAY
jgi:hypothetical protein